MVIAAMVLIGSVFSICEEERDRGEAGIQSKIKTRSKPIQTYVYGQANTICTADQTNRVRLTKQTRVRLTVYILPIFVGVIGLGVFSAHGIRPKNT